MPIVGTLGFIWRNPSFVFRSPSGVTRAVRKSYKVAKSMRDFKKLNKDNNSYFCQYTGSDKSLQVHHIIPVSVDPDLADKPENFLILSYKQHLYTAHGGKWTNFIKNIDDICRIRNLKISQPMDVPRGT